MNVYLENMYIKNYKTGFAQNLKNSSFFFNESYSLLIFRRMGSSWTGLSDRAREGSFTWLYANSCHRWTNWHRGEPNGHRNENCVELIPGWGGKWNDVSCNQRRTAVCHRVEGKLSFVFYEEMGGGGVSYLDEDGDV